MPGKSIDDKTLWTVNSTNDIQKEYKKGEYAESKLTYNEIIGSTVGDFEKTYPELSKEFQSIQQEQYELFAGKMMDYGLSNISLGSDLSTKEDKTLSLTGIWLRCNDKINRLKNLMKRDGKNYVNGEGMIDSFIDIANYGIIAMMVIRNKWK
tara:strand:- start:637 stop:1092 length:456 start_codon:yes stop_codon:yes gene_type:complete